MKIPKSVKIGGHDVAIVFEKSPSIGDKDCWGSFEAETKTIALKRSLCPSVREEVLIHEILHAVAIDRGANLTEKQVGAMSAGLYALLKNNGVLK
jgi:hypothetical protein